MVNLCYGAHIGVSNVETAASLVAQILRVDHAGARSSEASRVVSTTVPTIKSPRSPSLEWCGLCGNAGRRTTAAGEGALISISRSRELRQLLEGAYENNENKDTDTRLP